MNEPAVPTTVKCPTCQRVVRAYRPHGAVNELRTFMHKTKGRSCPGGSVFPGVPLPEEPAVTYSALDVICVRIRSTGSHGMTLVSDGGLGHRFADWAASQGIYSFGMGSSGPDGCIGIYGAEHADKIRAWLAASGGAEDDEKTWERRS